MNNLVHDPDVCIRSGSSANRTIAREDAKRYNLLDMNSYVYILECSDKTLYTGWTKDIERRVAEHNNGSAGARYTRARRPVKLVYMENCSSVSDAMKREASIKALSRREKLQLIKTAVL